MDRQNTQSIWAYKKQALSSGLKEGCRSELIFILAPVGTHIQDTLGDKQWDFIVTPELHGNIWLIIAGATMLEGWYAAFYQCRETNTTSQCIQLDAERGVRFATKLMDRTPKDALEYFISETNSLNTFIAQTSVVQLYEDVEFLLSNYGAWLVAKGRAPDDGGSAADGADGAAEYSVEADEAEPLDDDAEPAEPKTAQKRSTSRGKFLEYLREVRPGMFKTTQAWEACKMFANFMKQMGLFQSYKRWFCSGGHRRRSHRQQFRVQGERHDRHTV